MTTSLSSSSFEPLERNEMIQFHVTPLWSDYLRVQIALLYQHRRIVVGFAIISLLVFSVWPFLPYESATPQSISEKYWSAKALLILPGLIFVLLPAMTAFQLVHLWKSSPEYYAVRTWALTDRAIHTGGKGFEASTDWELIREAMLISNCVVLKTDQNAVHIISLREQSTSVRVDVINLVERKVARTSWSKGSLS